MWLFFAISCGNSHVNTNADGIYTKDAFSNILVDIHLAEAAQRLNLMDNHNQSELDSVYIEILKKHQSDTAEFNESFRWYSAHPVEFSVVYEMVINQLSVMKAKSTATEVK